MKNILAIIGAILAFIFGMKKAKQEGREEVAKEVELETLKTEKELNEKSEKQRNSVMSNNDIDEWL